MLVSKPRDVTTATLSLSLIRGARWPTKLPATHSTPSGITKDAHYLVNSLSFGVMASAQIW